MGMIPIALAIAGFVLLWSIVNYHSLSSRRAYVISLQATRNQLVSKYIVLIQQLAALLKIYNFTAPEYLINLANEPGQKIHATRLTAALEQTKAQTRGQEVLRHNPDYDDLLSQLETNSSLLLKNDQQLSLAIREYNGQATRMPYRIIAQLFGFKAINPATIAVNIL